MWSTHATNETLNKHREMHDSTVPTLFYFTFYLQQCAMN